MLPSGEHGRTRRGTRRRGDVKLGKAYAAVGKIVDMGGQQVFTAVAAKVHRAQVVGDDHQEIGTLFLRRRGRGEGGGQRQAGKDSAEFHGVFREKGPRPNGTRPSVPKVRVRVRG